MEEDEEKEREDEEPKVKYGWDENKRQSNLEKHGYDFADAHKLWESGAPVKEDYSERKGEERWKATGRIDADTTVVVYEEKREDLHWIISFREADPREKDEYERWLGKETGREDDLTKLIESVTREREEKEREQELQQSLSLDDELTKQLTHEGNELQQKERDLTKKQEQERADQQDDAIKKLLGGEKKKDKDRDEDERDR